MKNLYLENLIGNMKLYRYIVLSLLSLLQISALAQRLGVEVPSKVQTGENFRLVYYINTNDVQDYKAGSFPHGLEYIAGPYTSEQSNYQVVNGHMSSSSSLTITYTLYAAKSGKYTLPPFKVLVNGKWLTSKAAQVTVVGSVPNGGNMPKMHSRQEKRTSSYIGKLTEREIFVKVSTNKKRVYEQEPILVNYKLYSLVDINDIEGTMPNGVGFHTQELNKSQQINMHVENVNGKAYRTAVIKQYLLYPQMTGKLTIPSLTFKGTAIQENRAVDPVEAFFNGGSGYVETPVNIVAKGVELQVEPLPDKPKEFSGGVGRFNISAQLDKTKVKAGSPINLRIVVGGVGNLKLIKMPQITFPKGFDHYDAKVTDKTKLTANGVDGNMVYDIVLIPRQQGRYEIAPASFTYYDIQSKKYKTLKTQRFVVEVEPGTGGTLKDDAYATEQDIRPIKTGAVADIVNGEKFFGSIQYLVSLLIPILIFILLLIVFHRRAIENADVVKVRGKKANRLAASQLKYARDLMITGKRNEFYNEVLHALWGYVSNKFNIASSDLSRQSLLQSLQNAGVEQECIDNLLNLIEECEYERFAPENSSRNMCTVYESAINAIETIEDRMNRTNHTSKWRAKLWVFLFLCIPICSHAITKANADGEYIKKNYYQAIKDYEELLKQGKSADIYYNLGNAYFRNQDIPRAVLAYERAHKLAPGDRDINFNLDFARSHTIDQITPKSELFLISWYHALANVISMDQWAVLSIASIILLLVFVLGYLFGPTLLFRKIGFYSSCFFFFVFIFSNVLAFQQHKYLEKCCGAIIMSSSVNIKSSPNVNAKDKFILHEGTRVEIVDKSISKWRKIQLADGREGWIAANQIEEI